MSHIKLLRILAVFFVTLVMPASALHPASAGTVGFDDAITWWRMANNVTDSNVPPASDGTVTGTLNFGAAAGAGYQSNGTAALFTGSEYVDFSTSGTELDTGWAGGLTALARVKFDALGGAGEEILGRDGYNATNNNVRSFAIDLYTARGPAWRIWNGTSEIALAHPSGYPAGFIAGQYYDLVGVFRPGKSTEMYVNGLPFMSSPATFTSLNNPAGVPVRLGRRSGSGSPAPLTGDVESAAMWDQSLSPRSLRELTVGPRLMMQQDALLWLRFDNNYNDSNGFTYSNGTPSGGVSLVAEPTAPDWQGNDMVARFDGASGKIDLGRGGSPSVSYDDELSQDWSYGLTVFARVRQASATGDIFTRDGYYVSDDSNRNLDRSFALSTWGSSGPHFRIWSGNTEDIAQGPNGYPAGYFNEWHDLVGVFRPGESVEIWMDGQLLAESPTDFTSLNIPMLGSTPLSTFLGNNPGNGNFWEGDIESAAMWAYALSGTEIRALSGIPEPSTLTLLALGFMGLLWRRRRD